MTMDLQVLTYGTAVSGRLQLTATSGRGLDFLRMELGLVVPGHSLILPDAQAHRGIERAVELGLEVARLDRTLSPVPDPQEPAPPRRARDVHREHLRALRGQLTGEDKTAIRWALEQIERLETRLENIRRMAS